MGAIKTVGAAILGIAIFVGLIFLGIFLVNGTVTLAERLLPILGQVSAAAFVFCIVVLGPLSAFRVTRHISMLGFFVASYLFGLSVWLYGFLITYFFWGTTGVFIGLFLGVVGVVPLGILASLLHGAWYGVAELIFGLAVTYGMRALAFFLAGKIDSAGSQVLADEIKPGTPRRSSIAAKAWSGIWRTTVVLVIIVLGVVASIQTGWSAGRLLFEPGTFAEGHAVIPALMFLVALSCSLALLYAAFRLMKWSLLLLVPAMLYSCLVVGTWNGIESDFDYVRGEAIKHHYANVYALQHMSRRAFDLSCRDTRIELAPEAREFCQQPRADEAK